MKLEKVSTHEDGTRVYYEIVRGVNDSICLLFIHGWVMNYTTWEETRRFFQRLGYTTLTFDIRGHGKSTGTALSFQKAAEDIHCMLKAEKIPQAILVGYSMGGMIAQTYYHTFPESVKAMVLVNTNWTSPAKTFPVTRPSLVLYLLKNIMKIVCDRKKSRYFRNVWMKLFSHHNLFLKMLYRFVFTRASSLFQPIQMNTFHDYLDLKGKNDIAVFTEGLLRTSFQTVESFYIEELTFDMREKIEDIKVPCLLLAGAKDSVCPKYVARKMHKRLEKSDLFVLSDSDHLSILQENSRINTLMLSFLGSLPASL